MNISYNWLKDLIDIDLTAEDVAKELTRVGMAVEGIHPHGDDSILDIDLTSNRPDCLSHLGIARELSVSLSRPVLLPPVSNDVPEPASLASEHVKLEASDICHRFTARIIRGVKVGPSPEWLVTRLEALGERSINNIADITNYVMLELGQPMHAFDLDRLAGGRLVVRRASEGETITTLDGEKRVLDLDTLAICDAEKPAAIAGIIGGLESSITEATVNVLLEVAYFDRANIRGTSRRLGVGTEASYRFERGVDIQNLQRASDRAADLICQLAGGEKGEFYDIYPAPKRPEAVRVADLSLSVKRLTGLTVSPGDCDRILDALGIKRDGTSIPAVYMPPSWRHDIAIEEDLVEEVARHAGYENIGTELPPAFGAGEYQPGEQRKRRLRETLAAIGFDEAISYSFIDSANDQLFEPLAASDETVPELIELQDSVIEGAVRMRPTLAPGLLHALRLNINHQQRNLKLFEIGRVFSGKRDEDGLPVEDEVLGLVLTGAESFGGSSLQGRSFDLLDAKGSLEAALAAAGIEGLEFEPGSVRHLRQGQTAVISYHGRSVGTLGRLSEEVASTYKFKQPVYLGEVDLGYLLKQKTIAVAYEPLGRFPSVTRDVSLVGARDISWLSIGTCIEAERSELCRSVRFVDVYEGPPLDPNERSVTLRLEYRSDDRTLVEAEVDEAHSAILAALEDKLGVKPRT